MIKGWKLLTKKQRKHLRDNKIYTTSQWEETRRVQNEYDAVPGGLRACHECDEIARRLEDKQ